MGLPLKDCIAAHRLVRYEHLDSCCFHVVVADGNIWTANVRYCLERAQELGHADCITLGGWLLAMSRTQRLKLSDDGYEACSQRAYDAERAGDP